MAHSFSQPIKTIGRGECGGRYQDHCRGTSSGGMSDDHTRLRAHAAGVRRRQKELRQAIVMARGYRGRRLVGEARAGSEWVPVGEDPTSMGGMSAWIASSTHSLTVTC